MFKTDFGQNLLDKFTAQRGSLPSSVSALIKPKQVKRPSSKGSDKGRPEFLDLFKLKQQYWDRST